MSLKQTVDYLYEKNNLLEAVLIVRERLNEQLVFILLNNKKVSQEQMKTLMAVKYIFKVRIAYGLDLIDDEVYKSLRKINSMREKFVSEIGNSKEFSDEFRKEIRNTLDQGLELSKKFSHAELQE